MGKRVACFLLFFGLSLATERGLEEKPEKGAWLDIEVLQKKLQLSEEQVKKLKEVNNRFHEKALHLHKSLRNLKKQMDEILESDVIDRAKAQMVVTDIHEKKKELHLLRLDHRLAIEELLNAEQKSKFRSYLKERWRKHHERSPHH
ncbi:MAG: periplasmic heavy metal sensor [Leptospiraceae bacterium]|nr:periplasmic heavy metal sensor [Leptospiraceae bacterium]MDW8307455.1 periplasmic heavy metal sensor [Leptospiraceae bacterium]